MSNDHTGNIDMAMIHASHCSAGTNNVIRTLTTAITTNSSIRLKAP